MTVPTRNSYLRSEIATFVRTLMLLANNAPNEHYQLGWLEALAALASLADIDASTVAMNDRRPLR